ncbi:MAG: hypothetical protein AB7I19_09530 [Planctomycetota bacterium]
MTTLLDLSYRSLALLAFGCWASVAPVDLRAQAQGNPSAPPTLNKPVPPIEEEIEEVQDDDLCIVSLDFPGGTLSEFLDLLRQVLRTTETRQFHNLVATGPTSRISLEAMAVHRVEISDLFEVIALMVSMPHMVEFRIVHNGNGNPVMVVHTMLDESGSEDSGLAAKVAVDAFSLRNLTTALPGEPSSFALMSATVLTAIETALQMTPGEIQPARLRFHEDSGLLLVQGTNRQLDTIRMVLATMNDDLERLRQRHIDAGRQPAGGPKKDSFEPITLPPGEYETSKQKGR